MTSLIYSNQLYTSFAFLASFLHIASFFCIYYTTHKHKKGFLTGNNSAGKPFYIEHYNHISY